MRTTIANLARRRGKYGENLKSSIGKYTKLFANLPERYVVRASTRLMDKSDLNDPVQRKVLKTAPIYVHTMDRPWSEVYWRKNTPFQNPFKGKDEIYVEPILEEDWMWFRGDRVEVLKGKDKGKQGYINYIVQERNWVCVEGLNMNYTIVGRTSKFPGICMSEEQPLLVTTDIKLVDPSDELPTEVEWRYTESGERVRVSTRTETEIPIPSACYETIDYKTPQGYIENKSKDTPASIVQDITYNPKLSTFDMDIMKSMNIHEDRIPRKTFWY